ncbi:MAG: energy-coupling factor transporter transmembrane protein EcfT, partial [Thermoflexia bacterium]
TALRLVPTFAGAGATIVQAQISRGLDLESGNILQRAGKFIPLGVPLFIYAVRHTNMLAMALESKAFNPGAPRTWYLQLRMRRADYLALAVLTAIFLAALSLRLQGYGEVLPRL